MKRGEWKVDVNIGFWKCWAIFRADTKSISWSSRNEMICPFWWLAAAGINVHFEFWWSFSTITDYLWLKNWRERKTLPTLFSLGNLGSSEISFVAKCVNSLQLWSFDRISIERLHKISRHSFYPFPISQCLKISPNVALENFEFWHFPPIFDLLKLTCLVTLFGHKLQFFKNSPKWTIFGIFN